MEQKKNFFARISPDLFAFLEKLKKKNGVKSLPKLLLVLAIKNGYKIKKNDY